MICLLWFPTDSLSNWVPGAGIRFDTDRSVSARTRMEASDRRFQYKSSVRSGAA